MKTFKIVLSVILSIIFVFSVALNILLYSGSYGSLVFGYDEQSLKSMIFADTRARFNVKNTTYNNPTILNLNLLPKEGYVIKTTTKDANGNKSTEEYHVYLDKEKKINYSFKFKGANDSETESYYKEGVRYDNTNGVKAKHPLYELAESAEKSVINKIVDLYKIPLALFSYKNDYKIKTSIDFSFSPFYVLGIKVTFEKENSTTYILSYDLSGNLRKVTTKQKDGKETIVSISEKNKQVDFPNLDKYPLYKPS